MCKNGALPPALPGVMASLFNRVPHRGLRACISHNRVQGVQDQRRSSALEEHLVARQTLSGSRFTRAVAVGADLWRRTWSGLLLP